MTDLQQAVEGYLATRRALGYELQGLGSALRGFASFVAAQGASHITTELALNWAQKSAHAQPAQWANRLGMIRRFAQYHNVADPRTEIPSQDLLPHRYTRTTPHIYSDIEIERLIQAAHQLPSRCDLHPHTLATLFGLLAVSGMRISEALHLDDQDVDLDEGVLTIQRTKFRKSRLVPIHPSTQQALERYRAKRNRVFPRATTGRFFVSECGRELAAQLVRRTFAQLSRQTGVRGPTDSRGPRLHDFRHRFAVRTLLDWYRNGVDVERHAPQLATYLGHTYVKDTYWYLSATPELLHLAAARLDGPSQRSRP